MATNNIYEQAKTEIEARLPAMKQATTIGASASASRTRANQKLFQANEALKDIKTYAMRDPSMLPDVA